MKKKTNKEFISEAKQKFGNKLDYSKCKYIGANRSVIIICPTHGEFSIIPANFLHSPKGCQTVEKEQNENEQLQILLKYVLKNLEQNMITQRLYIKTLRFL